jgi:hypothetical protein
LPAPTSDTNGPCANRHLAGLTASATLSTYQRDSSGRACGMIQTIAHSRPASHPAIQGQDMSRRWCDPSAQISQLCTEHGRRHHPQSAVPIGYVCASTMDRCHTKRCAWHSRRSRRWGPSAHRGRNLDLPLSRGTSGAHQPENYREAARDAEISASRPERQFVRLFWSATCQHKTRPTGQLARCPWSISRRSRADHRYPLPVRQQNGRPWSRPSRPSAPVPSGRSSTGSCAR